MLHGKCQFKDEVTGLTSTVGLECKFFYLLQSHTVALRTEKESLSTKHYTLQERNVMFGGLVRDTKTKYMTSSYQWHNVTQHVGGSVLLNCAIPSTISRYMFTTTY